MDKPEHCPKSSPTWVGLTLLYAQPHGNTTSHIVLVNIKLAQVEAGGFLSAFTYGDIEAISRFWGVGRNNPDDPSEV